VSSKLSVNRSNSFSFSTKKICDINWLIFSSTSGIGIEGFTGCAFLQRLNLWTVFFISITEGKVPDIAWDDIADILLATI